MIYLAIDFGGGSGRVLAGKLENGKLEMELIHRFPNRQIRLGNHVYWDFLALFEDMKTGLKMAGAKGLKVDGIAIDTSSTKTVTFWATQSAIAMPVPRGCRKKYSSRLTHRHIMPSTARR